MAYSKVRVFDNVVEVDVVTDTAIHAANDVVAQPIELADAVQWNGCGVITSCVVTDYDDQGSALNLIFMRSPITVGANNATIAVSDGEVGEILGHVSVAAADYLNMANNQVATVTNCGLVIEPEVNTGDSDRSIWMAVSTTGTPTYASARLTIKVGILRG